VREKVAAVRASFRTEVKEPRVLRFDPAGRAIWSLAVLPVAGQGQAPSPVELTAWADQVLKKRLENVRGVGSVTLVGGSKREISLYLDPAAMEAMGVTADQVVAAVRGENQDLPVGTLRSPTNEWCSWMRVLPGRKTSAASSSRAVAARRCACSRWPA
jgi:HAE1 family hydrophobic/amphiphilic exporter-1